MKLLISIFFLSSQSLALEIGSRDLLELKVEGDQVVHWLGDGFDLGCKKGANCTFEGSKFSVGSYNIFYFRSDNNQQLFFDAVTVEVSKSSIKQKHEYRLLLGQRVDLNQSFGAALSGVAFLNRNGKKSLVKELPEPLKPRDVIRTAGESKAYIQESRDLSFLMLKESQLQIGGLNEGSHKWLQGTGIITSAKEVELHIGEGIIQIPKSYTRILIYDLPDGRGIFPLEGEFEGVFRSQKFKIKAPFGVAVNNKTMTLLSRLSCDDPREFQTAGLPFGTNCKEVDLEQIRELTKLASKNNIEVANPISKLLDLPRVILDPSSVDSTQRGASKAENLLKMGLLEDTSPNDSFDVKMRYLVRSKDCGKLASEKPGSSPEESLYQYYTSLCAIRESQYQRARNKLVWSNMAPSNEVPEESLNTLLASENLRTLPKGSLSFFVGRDSNGFLKGSDSSKSPFKAYSTRVTPFFGVSLEKSWDLFREGPLKFRLDLSGEGRGYMAENQIPYAKHSELLKFPLVFDLSKNEGERSQEDKKEQKVQLAPIFSIMGNGYPLETIGSGLEAELKMEAINIKTSFHSVDDFNSDPEVFDYLTGNPLAFATPAVATESASTSLSSKPTSSDRPFTTRAISLGYDFQLSKFSQSIFMERKASRYQQTVENNQSFTSFGLGVSSVGQAFTYIKLDGSLHYERRSYLEDKKGSVFKLDLKSTWDFSPDYSTYVKFSHTSSKGDLPLSTWQSTQILLGFSKEWR
jgi:hypothetical protein